MWQSLNGDEQPVVHVSWDDGAAFYQWTRPRLRFPTEAEWEYAARGGDGRVFPWGNGWPPPREAGNGFDDLRADGYAATAPVGKFAANPFGIYDLGGNVREWCADMLSSFRPDYPSGDATDPRGPESGDRRMVRGCSFTDGHRKYWRCAYRHGSTPVDRNEDLGLRPAAAAGTR